MLIGSVCDQFILVVAQLATHLAYIGTVQLVDASSVPVKVGLVAGDKCTKAAPINTGAVVQGYMIGQVLPVLANKCAAVTPITGHGKVSRLHRAGCPLPNYGNIGQRSKLGS